MKILLVGPSNRFQSGISEYTELLATKLAESGHQVGLLLMDKIVPSLIYPGRSRINELPKLQFDHKRISVIHTINYNSLPSRKLSDSISSFSPDIAIVQWWTLAVIPITFRVVRAISKLGIKLVFEMHEIMDQNDARVFHVKGLLSKFGGRILRKSNGIIVHSSSDRELAKSHYSLEDFSFLQMALMDYETYGKPMSKEEARNQLGIETDHIILAFGLIRRYKGVPELIRIFDGLEVSSVTLLIVGEIWDQEKEIKSMISKSRRNEEIVLIDRYVENDEVRVFFSAADLLAMPYSRASQSGVGAVAMHFQLPIVAYSVGGLVESVGEYSRGKLVEQGNEGEFQNAIYGCFQEDLEVIGRGDVSINIISSLEEWLRSLTEYSQQVDSS